MGGGVLGGLEACRRPNGQPQKLTYLTAALRLPTWRCSRCVSSLQVGGSLVVWTLGKLNHQTRAKKAHDMSHAPLRPGVVPTFPSHLLKISIYDPRAHSVNQRPN